MTLIHLLPLISFHFRCHDGHFFLSRLYIHTYVCCFSDSLILLLYSVYTYIQRDMYNHKNTFFFLLHLSQSSSFRLSETKG